MFRLTYDVADKVRQAEYVETGVAGPKERTVELEPDTPELRAALVELFELRTSGRLFGFEADHVLTPEEAKQVILDRAAKCRADEAREAEKRRRRQEAAQAAEALMARLRETEDLAEIASIRDEARRHPLYEAIYANRLHAVADTCSAKHERLRQQAEKAAREAERLAWARAHGSERLRRGLEAGYDMQRLYVTERAAIEAPGFVVDFDDNAAWKPRSGPSLEALDELERAKALQLGHGHAEIVWLTRPPTSQIDAFDDEYEACEAVVIYGYLGKYDLVKVVA